MVGRRAWLLLAIPITVAIAACRDRETSPSVAVHAPVASSAPRAAASAAERSLAPLVTSLGIPLMPPGVKCEPDPHWADMPDARVELDETFLLELGMGSGMDGLNVTTIAVSGRASHVYSEIARHEGVNQRTWRRVEFEVAPAELDALVRMLNEQRFLQLPIRFRAPGIDDGARWIVHVRTLARDKYVTLDNAFPDPLYRIARFVKEELVDKRPDLRGRSALLELSGDDHLWRWVHWYEGCDQDLHPLDDDGACPLLGVSVRLRSDAGLPPGARYEVKLLDRTDGDRVLARSAGRLGTGELFVREASTFLRVRYDQVDVRHHYDVTARVVGRGRTWTAPPKSVMSYGEPHQVDLSLRRDVDGG